MRRRQVSLFAILLAFATAANLARAEEPPKTLMEARKGFSTKLIRQKRDADPMPKPPPSLFTLVKYSTSLGPMSAMLGKPRKAGVKHPAIIWITGGFPAGGIGKDAWEPCASSNDQSAKVYRQANLIMMYPALRGSFGNPGFQETLYGEVDDVLAALKYLKTVAYVDPERIYLGGHSTGGTLALLVAEATDGFRAVFSFGPAENPALYGAANLTYNPFRANENRLRSPIHFLGGIKSPTYVIEGHGRFGGDQGADAGDGSLVLFAEGDHLVASAREEPVRFLLMAGKPLGEPIAWRGPIVMNTEDELELAFEEYSNGTFIKHEE